MIVLSNLDESVRSVILCAVMILKAFPVLFYLVQIMIKSKFIHFSNWRSNFNMDY